MFTPVGRIEQANGGRSSEDGSTALETDSRRVEMMRFPWLDYDMIALVVLGFAISSIALVAFNI
jgi:hypothetical protein